MNVERLKQIATHTLHSSRLLPIFWVGALSSIVEVTAGISYATLMFSGSLSPYLSIGISIALLTALESGQISSLTGWQTAQETKLQTLKAGTLLGELDFYTRSPHTTTAVANQLSTVYGLSRTDFEKMQQNHAAAAATFQSFVIQLLSDRVVQSQKAIDTLRS